MTDFFSAIGQVFGFLAGLSIYGINIIVLMVGIALISLIIGFIRGKKL